MQKRLAVKHVLGMGICSWARACRALRLSRSTAYYQSKQPIAPLAQEALVAEVSRKNPEMGYRKVTAILRTQHAEIVNPKRVARLRRFGEDFSNSFAYLGSLSRPEARGR